MAMIFGKQMKRRSEGDEKGGKKARGAREESPCGDKRKRKRSSTAAMSTEEEDSEPCESSLHRGKDGKKTRRSEANRSCALCGRAGPDSGGNDVNLLQDATRSGVLLVCSDWKAIPGDAGLSSGCRQTREHALRLKHVLSDGEGIPVWKHRSCLDAVRHPAVLKRARVQVAKYLLRQEGEESRRTDTMSDAGAAEPETPTGPRTRSQLPSVKEQPGRTGLCALCQRGGKVRRVCEPGSMQNMVTATAYHRKHPKSSFHDMSNLVSAQYMRLDDIQSPSDASKYVLAKDLEIHNACRLKFCRAAGVYLGETPHNEPVRARKARVELGVCEFIRDALTEHGEGSVKYGVKVSDTYELYEKGMGNQPGSLRAYREQIVKTYNEHVAPATRNRTELVCTMDENARTKGGYFSLVTSKQDALLFLCRQEEKIEQLMEDMVAFESLKLSSLDPTVKQSFHVTSSCMRAAFRQVKYTEGVTTGHGVTEMEAQRCGGGAVVTDFLYDCCCDEKEHDTCKQGNPELKRRCQSVAQDICFAATGTLCRVSFSVARCCQPVFEVLVMAERQQRALVFPRLVPVFSVSNRC